MAEPWISVGEEIVDCSTMSLSYSARGLGTLTFTIYKKKGEDPPYVDSAGGVNVCIGDIRFRGWVSEIHQSPSQDSDAIEYRVTSIGIGCKDATCSQGVC